MCQDVDCMCYDGEVYAQLAAARAEMDALRGKVVHWSAMVRNYEDVTGEIYLDKANPEGSPFRLSDVMRQAAGGSDG